MKISGDETIHPLECGVDRDGDKNYHHTGLTKREHFAAMAMQGILTTNPFSQGAELIARASIKMADELINQLNK